MDDSHLLRSFEYYCRARGLRPKSLKDYAARLDYLTRWLGDQYRCLPGLTTDDVRRYVVEAQDLCLSPVTINGRIKIWKMFYAYCIEEHLLDGPNPLDRIHRLREEVRIKPALTTGEVEILLSSFDRQTFTGLRDWTMVITTIDTCVRVGELVRIRLDDVELEKQVITIHHTKSYQDRLVPLSPTTIRALYNYQIRWRNQLPGDHLFCYRNGDPLDLDRFRKILLKQAARVGVKPCGPHCLRRTGAQCLHEAGMSPELRSGPWPIRGVPR